MEKKGTEISNVGSHEFMALDLIKTNNLINSKKTKIPAIAKFDIYSLTAVIAWLETGETLTNNMYLSLSKDYDLMKDFILDDFSRLISKKYSRKFRENDRFDEVYEEASKKGEFCSDMICFIFRHMFNNIFGTGYVAYDLDFIIRELEDIESKIVVLDELIVV